MTFDSELSVEANALLAQYRTSEFTCELRFMTVQILDPLHQVLLHCNFLCNCAYNYKFCDIYKHIFRNFLLYVQLYIKLLYISQLRYICI